MHGQKRAEYKARLFHPDTRAKLGSKAQQWNHLSEELLKQRRRLFASPPPLSDVDTTSKTANDGGDAADAAAPSPEVLLALTEKMLSVNPDPSHLWNIRREMLVYLIHNQEDVDNDISSIFDIEAELKLTAHCLQRNPKSYSAWFHRKWALVYFMNGTSQKCEEHWTNMKSILQSELELCVQFLQLDERNFHCWNFRRFVVGLLGSCGGSDVAIITSSENNVDGDNVDNDASTTPSAADSVSGSWSAWMHQIENENKDVWMGPQISQNACRAVGMSSSCKEGSNNYYAAKSATVSLSERELKKIIMNEWDFSTAKIQDNFSNGSAFHYRSKLLPLVLEFRSSDDSASFPNESYEAIILVREEWDGILLDAIFTEPDDQTIWFYHRFIVTWARRTIAAVGDGADADVTEEFEELLYDMVDSIQELIDVEKEDNFEVNTQDRHESKGAKCKWAYLGMHLVLTTLLEFKSKEVGDNKTELCERAKECLEELMIIDPDRRERYQILESELK